MPKKPWKDPIVEEVRKVREEHAARSHGAHHAFPPRQDDDCRTGLGFTPLSNITEYPLKKRG
jgi:hypothetical protein